MLATVTTIARNTFIEAIRQPVYPGLVVLAGFLQIINTWVTGYSMGFRRVAGEVTGDDKLLFDVGLSTVFVCGTLLAAFIATSAISREIENKTILTVVSKPIARPAVVVGKFLGISGALLVAVYIMLIFLLMAIRHGVLSTAADDPDQPVITFGLLSVGLPLLFAAFMNYYAGWTFVQTFVAGMVACVTLAYGGVLFVGKEWVMQSPVTDLKPQVMLACGALSLALLVLASVATAASTRLGQVMTITVCAGVFLLGLLSNHLIGRHAFANRPVGEIEISEPTDKDELDLGVVGTQFDVTFVSPPTTAFNVGDPFYFGPAPNGVALITPGYEPVNTDRVRLGDTRFGAEVPPGLAVTQVDGDSIRVKHVGGRPLDLSRNPEPGDFVFLTPTRMNPLPLAAWGLIPNMHYFWTVDAVSQNRPVPASHLALVALYASVQILVYLSLAVLLFQDRDVG